MEFTCKLVSLLVARPNTLWCAYGAFNIRCPTGTQKDGGGGGRKNNGNGMVGGNQYSFRTGGGESRFLKETSRKEVVLHQLIITSCVCVNQACSPRAFVKAYVKRKTTKGDTLAQKSRESPPPQRHEVKILMGIWRGTGSTRLRNLAVLSILVFNSMPS
eukprot:1103477-Pelagomonas_calceolata.AAC.1